MTSFNISERLIGEDAPIFIIAEAGVNHAGSFSEAQEMVNVAARCQADAVTFQHIAWDEINSSHIVRADHRFTWDNWRLSDDQIADLFEQAHNCDLAVTACVVDPVALEFIVKAGADFIKIVSGDLTCHPFLAECAQTGLPIFLSTGDALLPEIEAALEAIDQAGGTKVVLYHTNSQYPTPPEQVDLRALEVLKAYSHPVGFCDHTVGTAISLAAAALGARVIEKHFSLNPAVIRPDYQVSVGPEDLCRLITDIRCIEKALGNPGKVRYASEEPNYIFARRSITAGKDLQKGCKLRWEDICYKRPGTGLPPSEAEKYVGRLLAADIKKGAHLYETSFSQ